MKIAFPKQRVMHRRKQPRPSILNREAFFGVPGKVLTCLEAMAVYHKIQDFLDLCDVETEIDYREEEEELTQEEAAEARSMMKEIADDYRARMDDDGHWNDVLVNAINWTIGTGTETIDLTSEAITKGCELLKNQDWRTTCEY